MNTKQVSATGDVITIDSYLSTVILTAGSDAATLTVKQGGSGGTTIATIKAAANTTVVANLAESYVADGIHATLAGTGPVASFTYES